MCVGCVTKQYLCNSQDTILCDAKFCYPVDVDIALGQKCA